MIAHMGMYVTFVRMTPDELDKAETDPDWAEQFLEDFYDYDGTPPPENSEVDIQKSWAGLDHLLDEAMLPFSIQEGGYCIANGNGWYLNLWTVADLADAAKFLAETPFDTLAAHYDAEAMSREEVYPNARCWDADDLQYLRRDYDDLRAFFVAAADSGHGAMMSFG